MGIISSIAESFVRPVLDLRHHMTPGYSVGAQFVCDLRFGATHLVSSTGASAIALVLSQIAALVTTGRFRADDHAASISNCSVIEGRGL
jgi:hypothetical protein